MSDLSTSSNVPRSGATSRRRALRWLVPVGAVGVVALIASGVLSAGANPNLAPQTSAQLLASVGDAKLSGFSGTVIEKASLGLPELPNIAGPGGSSSSGLLGMLTGSHTVRVWYGGETEQRLALVDSLGEQDVFRNGRDLWQWDSESRIATHTLLPTDAAKINGAPAEQTPYVSPSDAAARALALIDPSTTVTTEATEVVAGRSAYTLVLTPKDGRSRVGSVRISVDGKTKVPLRVVVTARGSNQAAIDVGFTQVRFAAPDQDNFTFKPAAGVTIKESPAPAAISPGAKAGNAPVPAGAGYTVIGSGWTSVAKLTGVPSLSALTRDSGEVGPLIGGLPAVSGTWGSGHLFTSSLISALLTNDGRAYVGAVDPEVLYQAASRG
ncbi:LolA family protein [Jatrophihabitans sp. DSM 45814]